MKNSLTSSTSQSATSTDEAATGKTKTIKLGKAAAGSKAKNIQAETRTFALPVVTESPELDAGDVIRTQVQSVTVVTKRRSRLAVAACDAVPEVVSATEASTDANTPTLIDEKNDTHTDSNATPIDDEVSLNTLEASAVFVNEDGSLQVATNASKAVVKVKKKRAIASTTPAESTIATTPTSVDSPASIIAMAPAVPASDEDNKPVKAKARASKANVIAEVNTENTSTQAASSNEIRSSTIADIDTSAYTLPTVKEAARRGRKPSSPQVYNDEIHAFNAVESSELKRAARVRAGKAVANEASKEQLEEYRQRLTKLIQLGKDRSYLTHAEINDHLPENVDDPEMIQSIISTLNDVGIAVYDQAPDATMLLLSKVTLLLLLMIYLLLFRES